jgi:hypothetical protein
MVRKSIESHYDEADTYRAARKTLRELQVMAEQRTQNGTARGLIAVRPVSGIDDDHEVEPA